MTTATYTAADTDDAAHAAALAQGAQERYQAAIAHIQAGLHELEAATLGLPEIPSLEIREAFRHLGQPVWKHEYCDLRVVTEGLAQSSSFDPETVTASTNGWSDMGDMDGPSYLYDFDCGIAFKVPADMDWS